MKKLLWKTTACCLVGSMFLSYGLLAQASTTAGVTSVLSENVTLDNGTLYAGVNDIFSQYLVTSAEVNLNHVAEVRAAEQEALAQQLEAAIANSEYSDLGVANVDSYVNVRKAPTTDAEVAGKLYTKNVATILSEENGWYKIQSGDLQGYVSAEFVIAGDKAALDAAGTRVAKVNTDGLRVRESASTDSEILNIVGINEELIVKEEVDGWVKVSVQSGDGWVSSEFVTCKTNYTYGETKAAEEARLQREAEERAAAQRAAAAKSNKGSSSNKNYNPPSGGSGSSVASFACQFVGNPYVWGGTSLTNGADCSGFVMSVYKAFGVSLPHSSYSLRSVGYGVSTSEMQPGDIVCYSGHVGIYIGGGQIVHASNSTNGIIISSAYYTRILAVRRIF